MPIRRVPVRPAWCAHHATPPSFLIPPSLDPSESRRSPGMQCNPPLARRNSLIAR
ncbi:hypothetical protein BO71DRAFT_404526 [Aspergillus ellipticus CBS 707.79]|uniref:Uncharacterized protein n=1 Tax=Aspergillus ellipticus CBS 707.79 TaxID=1448320 RepID=A0A319D978_9EURO|nr:hypothetical protein BO71DRAFT_404526 [Aspergillus ellipticus CBS 707.79]